MQNARTALDIAQQQVVNARYNMNASEIRATQSGFVLKKYAQEGQIVTREHPSCSSMVPQRAVDS
jgi:multidrug resistance efflux pump